MKYNPEEDVFSDIILSTRVRLARNLRTMPFPAVMDDAARSSVAKQICAAMKGQTPAGVWRAAEISALGKIQAIALVEQHLISPEFTDPLPGRVLMRNEDDSVSAMLNEEDHLRLQVLLPGFCLQQAYDRAEEMDRFLENRLPFAFDDEFGYLTQCPTNLGTGMRASLMMHLPAMQENGMMQRMGANLSKLGLTLRGIYGEGSKPKGAIYQLSNQVTLGLSERSAIENLNNIARQLAAQERTTRASLMKSEKMQDIVLRSLGLLKNARLLSNDEFMVLLSQVRVGVAEKWISGVSQQELNRLMQQVQPATISISEGRTLESAERDRIRAAKVRAALHAAEECEPAAEE